MKLRLPQRMSQRTGWIIVACLAAPVVLLFLGPFAYFGLSLYWLHYTGHAIWCDTRTTSEAVSPSGRWSARVRLVACGALAGGPFVEAVLVPNVAFPFLGRYRIVFVRELVDDMPDSERLAVHWADDHSLELSGVPCVPCQATDYKQPCDSECRFNDADGITVSFKAAK